MIILGRAGNKTSVKKIIIKGKFKLLKRVPDTRIPKFLHEYKPTEG
jgi:hypothetical protein